MWWALVVVTPCDHLDATCELVAIGQRGRRIAYISNRSYLFALSGRHETGCWEYVYLLGNHIQVVTLYAHIARKSTFLSITRSTETNIII